MGPTEVRLFVIILNTVLYFTGIGGYIWTIDIQGEPYGLTIGSIIVFIVAIAFLIYYLYQVIRTATILAAQDEARLEKRKAKEARKVEKAEKKAHKAEKKAQKELEAQANAVSTTVEEDVKTLSI